jgi:8-oxo-dGTP diphosphatase
MEAPPREAAVIFFVNQRGELLLRLRDDNGGIPHPNLWDTIGGAIESGEAPSEALRREVYEELGIGLCREMYWRTYQAMALVHIYVGPLNDPSDALILTEGQGVAWVTPQDALGLALVPWVRAVIPELVQSDLYVSLVGSH